LLQADNARIRAMFGWSVQHGIEDTMSELWRKPELARGLIEKYT